jgi:AraC-like DNA-binding protein
MNSHFPTPGRKRPTRRVLRTLAQPVLNVLTVRARILGHQCQAADLGGRITNPLLDDAAPDLLVPGEQWRVQLGAAFGHLQAERDRPGHQLAGRLSGTVLGRAGVFEVAGTPQIVRRTRDSINAAPADPLKLCIQQAGRAVVHQGATEIVISPGELAVYDTGQPYAIRLEGDWRCGVMTVPRESLGLSPTAMATAMGRTLPVTGLGGVLAHWLTTCLESAGPATVAGERLGEAGVQLVASLLCGPDESPAEDVQRERIRQFLRTSLSDPDLCPAVVAAAHNISERTLHRLFEREPMTVAETIRALRLEATYADLANPRLRRTSVMAIAARWGFRDQAHFTRTFRARYGVTPAKLRRDNAN